jgi:hypothetical protein
MTLAAYEQIAPRGKQVIEPGKRSAEVEVAVMGSRRDKVWIVRDTDSALTAENTVVLTDYYSWLYFRNRIEHPIVVAIDVN